MAKSEFDPKDLELLKNNSEFHPDDLKALSTPSGETAEPIDTGILNTILHHGASGASLGTSAQLAGAIASPTGAAQDVANLVGTRTNTPDTAAYEAARDREQAILEAQSAEHPIISPLSSFIGGIPTAMAGGAALGAGRLAMGLKPLTMIKEGAALGGIAGGIGGAIGSKDQTLGGALGSGVIDATTGAAGGALGGQLMKGAFGNAADIASGALPEGTAEVKGLLSGATEGPLAQEVKKFFKNADKNTNSLEAEQLRGIENKTAAQDILSATNETKNALGEAHRANVNASEPMKLNADVTALPESEAEAATRLANTDNTQEIKALNETNKLIDSSIAKAPPEALADIMTKTGTGPVTDEVMQRISPLLQGKETPDLLPRVQKFLTENPTSTFDDAVAAMLKGSQEIDPTTGMTKAPSLSEIAAVDKALQQAKQVIAVDNLVTQSAAKNGGTAEDGVLALQALMTKKVQLSDSLNTVKPIGMKVYIDQLNPKKFSNVADAQTAQALQNEISKFTDPNGNILGSQKIPFRDAMFNFASNQNGIPGASQDIPNFARQLGMDARANINSTSAESSQYNVLQSLHDILNVNKGANPTETNQQIASKLAAYIEGSESGANGLKTGRMQDIINEFKTASGNNPKINNAIDTIAQNVEASSIYKAKGGGTGASTEGLLKRLLFNFPIETAGKIATNPMVKFATDTTISTSKYLSELSPAGWRYLGANLESPYLKGLAGQMEKAQDPIKKAAIISILQQLPSFSESLKKMASESKE